MRTMTYLAAIAIAAGLIYYIGSPADSTTGESASGDAPINGEVSTVALSVPDMHCPYGCYPKVKETLEAVGGVASVELAPQKTEGELDNRAIFVSYSPNFDLATALEKLSDAGFPASEIDPQQAASPGKAAATSPDDSGDIKHGASDKPSAPEDESAPQAGTAVGDENEAKATP